MMRGPLHGHDFGVHADGEIGVAATMLLEQLGARKVHGGDSSLGTVKVPEWRGNAEEWAASGAMTLTGHADGPPLAPDAPLGARLRAAEAVLALLSSCVGRRVDVDVLALLGERAALAGLTRRGRTSVGGAARLLEAHDGWVVVNLARDSDVESIPAWLELDEVATNPWEAVATAIARRDAAEVVDRAQLLGIAAAVVPEAGTTRDDPQLAPWVISGEGGQRPPTDPPLVVDLSPLWAGPLCAHLLGLAGARVVKVESTGRPDAMRAGNPALFDLLHSRHESVALDLAASEGQGALHELILQADVVIEESRPRALEQMGIVLDEVRRERPNLTWVSITGYGRSGPWSDRVAFGDDAAAAAGLVVSDDRGAPVFCADAIADPITGVFAAIGALASLLGGGGHLVDVALRDAAGYACGDQAGPRGEAARIGVAEPRARPVHSPARPFGADTARVLKEMGVA
jgi:crotonobetainyl-CoA:carnitine CoA-transferase CaiB-like acyl-CoA transferase